jgi:signal transduction histidine kinase
VKRLSKFCPRRMAGQMIALVLAGFIISQIIVIIVITLDRREAIREFESARLIDRLAVTVRIIERSPPNLARHLSEATSSSLITFWVTRTPVLPVGIAEHGIRGKDSDKRLRDLRERIGNQRDIRFNEGDEILDGARLPRRPDFDRDDDDDDDDDDWKDGKRKDGKWKDGKKFKPDYVLSIGLRDGRWLNAGVDLHRRIPLFGFQVLTSFAVTGGVLALVIIISVRRITRPLRNLAAAADRAGRGDRFDPLREEGPQDLRETIHAFNLMQERLERFVSDRTKMLAALGHDLRTPITSLKLQTEFIEDEELRERMQRQLDEMHQMAESALAFARDASDSEPTRSVDLPSLLESLADDLGELGMEVQYEPGGRVTFACRPVSLKRAVRNLVVNAVTHGGAAEISLAEDNETVSVTVSDNGPGIPDEDIERVFRAFERLDEARNQDSGGAGLGLTIARTIARAHGGDVTLANRPEGGLAATITLPKGRTSRQP